MSNNTQATNLNTYNPTKNMVFGSVKDVSFSGASFKRIPISTLYPDGSIGDLIFFAPEMDSKGVEDFVNQTTGIKDGWMTILFADPANAEHLKMIEGIKKINQRVREYLCQPEVADSIGKELSISDSSLKDPEIGFLKYRRDKVTKKFLMNEPPYLGPKLMELRTKDSRKPISVFYDAKGNNIEPLSILGQPGRIVAGIKIEDIYIGVKILIRAKVWEAKYLPSSRVPKALNRPAAEEDMDVDLPVVPQRLGFATAAVSSSPTPEAEEDIVDDIEEDELPPPVKPVVVVKPVAPVKAKSVKK
jgi:hypothetical protein